MKDYGKIGPMDRLALSESRGFLYCSKLSSTLIPMLLNLYKSSGRRQGLLQEYFTVRKYQ